MLTNPGKRLLYMTFLYALFGLLFGVVYLLLFGENTLISVVIIIPIIIALLFLAIERMIIRKFSDRKIVRIAVISSIITVVLLFAVSTIIVCLAELMSNYNKMF